MGACELWQAELRAGNKETKRLMNQYPYLWEKLLEVLMKVEGWYEDT